MSERIQNVQSKWYNGVKYRSTLEADVAETLDLMGVPFEYETKTIILFDHFRCPYQKRMVERITYTPDFIVGKIIIECKGWETPEWMQKKKFVFKWLMDNEPDTPYYIIKDEKKSLLAALDSHWSELGYVIRVTSKKKDKKTNSEPIFTGLYSSVRSALENLNLKGKSLGIIMRSLTGRTEYVFGYSWKLEKLKI